MRRSTWVSTYHWTFPRLLLATSIEIVGAHREQLSDPDSFYPDSNAGTYDSKSSHGLTDVPILRNGRFCWPLASYAPWSIRGIWSGTSMY